MPCRYEESPQEIETSLRERFGQEADKVTALLCRTCYAMADSHIDKVEGLRAWWTIHKAKDIARRQQEGKR